jgi:hypothetical protein
VYGFIISRKEGVEADALHLLIVGAVTGEKNDIGRSEFNGSGNDHETMAFMVFSIVQFPPIHKIGSIEKNVPRFFNRFKTHQ